MNGNNIFIETLKNFFLFFKRKNLSKEDLIALIADGMCQAKLASDDKFKSRSAKVFLNEL